jgi:hypothetical protein
MAAQVGFFLESFGVQTIGLGIYNFNMLFAYIVDFVLQTLPKTMKRTFMHTRNKTFYDLISQQL